MRRLAIIVPLLLACACAGPTVNVIRSSGPPSALRGGTPLAYVIDLSQATIEGAPIAQHIGGLPPNEQGEWQQILGEMPASMIDGLSRTAGTAVVPAEQAPQAPVRVQITVQQITPGYYRFSSQDGEITSDVSFMVNGQLSDQLSITTRSRAVPAEEPTVRGRMNSCMLRIGELSGDFFRGAQ